MPFVLQVDAKDRGTLDRIRQMDLDLVVETTGAQQSLVKVTKQIGRCNHKDIAALVLIRLEPIHLIQ